MVWTASAKYLNWVAALNQYNSPIFLINKRHSVVLQFNCFTVLVHEHSGKHSFPFKVCALAVYFLVSFFGLLFLVFLFFLWIMIFRIQHTTFFLLFLCLAVFLLFSWIINFRFRRFTLAPAKARPPHPKPWLTRSIRDIYEAVLEVGTRRGL